MKKAFTLVELLACIIVISIILVISIPRVNETLKEDKEDSFFTSAKSLLRQIEYININTSGDDELNLEELDIDIPNNSYDLNYSSITITDGEISLNLKGLDTYKDMYLCGMTSSSRLNKNICVRYVPCENADPCEYDD